MEHRKFKRRLSELVPAGAGRRGEARQLIDGGFRTDLKCPHCTARQILARRPPLAAGAQHIHDAIRDFPDVHLALGEPPRLADGIGGSIRLHSSSVKLVPAKAGGGDRLGIAQLAPVVAFTVFRSPHRRPLQSIAPSLESQMIQAIQYVFGRRLRH